MNATELNAAIHGVITQANACRCIWRTNDCYEQAKYAVLKAAARLAMLLDKEIEAIEKETIKGD